MLHLGSPLCCRSMVTSVHGSICCRVTLSSRILCLSSSRLCSSIVKFFMPVSNRLLFPIVKSIVFQVDNIVFLSYDVTHDLVFAYIDKKTEFWRVTIERKSTASGGVGRTYLYYLLYLWAVCEGYGA